MAQTQKPSREAIAENDLGLAHEAAGRAPEAEAAYRRATRADAVWSAPWFNLGLLLKRQRRWAESLEANREALVREPDDQAAHWNLGIAATATRNWAEARRGWARFGIKLPPGDGPFDLRLGLVPIRLDPGGRAEVVWCRRLDPATAEVASVPLPESGFRFKDRVLHDGEPKGERTYRGRQVPVFDALDLLERSAHLTYPVRLGADEAAIEALLEQADADPELALELWSRSVRMLCKRCSEGVAHREHDPPPPDADPRPAGGLAARTRAEAEALLARWAAAGPGRTYELGDPGET